MDDGVQCSVFFMFGVRYRYVSCLVLARLAGWLAAVYLIIVYCLSCEKEEYYT